MASLMRFTTRRPNEAAAQLHDVFGDPANPDPLHPDLEEYIDHNSPFGMCIRHPLVYSIAHVPPLNRQMNTLYGHKQEACRRALDEGRYDTYVWLHERPWRLVALSDIAQQLTDQHYWSLLGSLWTDSENICQNYQLWHDALHSQRSSRWAIMSKEDRATVRKFRRRKRQFAIFRGFAYDEGDRGMSWTLNYERARWFALRFAGLENRERPQVAIGLIHGYNIIAYFSDRGEEEIVALPEDVNVLKAEELPYG